MLFRQDVALSSFQYKGNKAIPEKLYDMKNRRLPDWTAGGFFVA